MNGPAAIGGSRPVRPPAAARDIVAALECEGWEFDGIAGDSHLRFRHPSGATVRAASTPGGNKARALAVAVAKARRALREAGVAPDPRPPGRRGSRPAPRPARSPRAVIRAHEPRPALPAPAGWSALDAIRPQLEEPPPA